MGKTGIGIEERNYRHPGPSSSNPVGFQLSHRDSLVHSVEDFVLLNPELPRRSSPFRVLIRVRHPAPKGFGCIFS